MLKKKFMLRNKIGELIERLVFEGTINTWEDDLEKTINKIIKLKKEKTYG